MTTQRSADIVTRGLLGPRRSGRYCGRNGPQVHLRRAPSPSHPPVDPGLHYALAGALLSLRAYRYRGEELTMWNGPTERAGSACL